MSKFVGYRFKSADSDNSDNNYFDVLDTIDKNIIIRGSKSSPRAIGLFLIGDKRDITCCITLDIGSSLKKLIKKNISKPKLIMELHFPKDKNLPILNANLFLINRKKILFELDNFHKKKPLFEWDSFASNALDLKNKELDDFYFAWSFEKKEIKKFIDLGKIKNYMTFVLDYEDSKRKKYRILFESSINLHHKNLSFFRTTIKNFVKEK